MSRRRILDLTYSVVIIYKSKGRQIEAAGRIHASLDKEYLENILNDERIIKIYPYMKCGVTSRQINSIWEAVKHEINLQKIMGLMK